METIQSEDRYSVGGTEPRSIELDEEEEQLDPVDEDDAGGDQVLAEHKDKNEVKLRRSFELVLRTGQVVRLEVSKTSVQTKV